MATQIAPTPVVRGDAARVIYEETRRRPTQASERGAMMLADKFGGMSYRGNSVSSSKALDNYDKFGRSDRMSEPRFKSSISMEEIENNFKDIDFFAGIMDGLTEALAYTNDEAERWRATEESVAREAECYS